MLHKIGKHHNKLKYQQRKRIMANSTLFIVGGTGGLGQQVAKGLATARGFDSYKALVRSVGSPKAKALREMGWELVQVENFQDGNALEKGLEGAKTVVSTVGGGDMVPTEKALIRAAKKAGAGLYVPSQFGVDYRRWGTRFPFLAGKAKVLEEADAVGLPTLKVFVGLFSDSIFSFLADPPNAKGRIVGDGSAKLSFTRRSDIGYVLAKALEDPDLAKGGTLSMQGDNLSWKESLEILAKVLGRQMEIEYVDPSDALKKEEEQLEKGTKGDVGAFYASFALHLLGEPARGNTGGDVSAEAKSYGVKLETLEETLTTVYGAK